MTTVAPDPRQSELILRDTQIVPAYDPRASCVIADPPWKFKNAGSRGAAQNHYPTMSIRELCALPVDQWVRDNAYLFMWVVDGVLDGDDPYGNCFTVMRHWGFKFKMTLAWAKVSKLGKVQMGMGNYIRHSHEMVLFGVRGRMPPLNRAQLSLFWGPRGQHSRKPDNLHEIAEKISPPPYLEMFARRGRPGWFSWGNEAPDEHAEEWGEPIEKEIKGERA
jgi:N6-adenosine-specific RNA methylase IME4